MLDDFIVNIRNKIIILIHLNKLNCIHLFWRFDLFLFQSS